MLNRLASNRAEIVSFHRFFNNSRVNVEALKKAQISRCNELAAGKRVLAIEDTTQFNFTHHSGKLRPGELGGTCYGNEHVLLLHPTLIYDLDQSIALGFGDVRIWTRDPDQPRSTKERHKQLPVEQKESYRWIESARQTRENISSAKQVIVVTDREGDIYELFDRVPDNRTDLLVRASHDRSLADQDSYLFQHLDGLPVQGSYKLELRSTRDRSKHEAQIEVRFDKVKLLKPRKRNLPGAPKTIELFVVDAREHPSTVKEGENPVHWRLYTTCPVETLEDAREIIEWYCLRWQIEQLFRTLKTKGLNFEESQMETFEGLSKLLVMALDVALKIMQLTHVRDGEKDLDADLAFSKEEIKVIGLLLPKYEGKTEKQKNHFRPGSLAWAAWLIARAGGWKGYKSEAPPGPITMRRGLDFLAKAYMMYKLLRE